MERTALRIERAILTSDKAARLTLLLQTLAEDRDVAGWAICTAERRTASTINLMNEAADWLSENLLGAMAASLESETALESTADVESRLPALVAKLADYEHQLGNFEQRLEHEKLESLKELAYGASHEINNPLANIAARAQTLLEDEHDPERARKITAIHRQAMRAHEMISDLMLFARPPKLVRRRFDLRKLATRVVHELDNLASEYSVTVSCEDGDTPIEVTADETQIGVAMQALLKNAFEAAAQGGRVAVALRIATVADRSVAEVSVRDDGPGFSEQVRRHMFDPFFSGREAGRGLGFGLSKCWRIVTDHGGDVIVGRQGQGAEICMRLPIEPPTPAASEQAQAADASMAAALHLPPPESPS
jgi:signal transduction histidine kinase